MKLAARCLALLTCCVVGAGSASAQNLLMNGDFESGLSNWTTWSVSNGFWGGAWIHSNDCDIWPPFTCPFGGAGESHAQKKGSGGGNAHGGLYQTVTVTPGTRYRLSGQWAGGVTGNAAGNATWWEVVVFDGVVDDAVIDAGTRPQDTQVARLEVTDLPFNGVHQFQWQPFSAEFVATSPVVTVVLKTGSFYTFDAAAYHDNLVMQALPAAVVTPVAVGSSWMLFLTALGVIGVVWRRRRL